MTAIVSLGDPAQFSTLVAPTLPSLLLTDEEQEIFQALSRRLTMASADMRLRNAYYEGWQQIIDLGISVPPSLGNLRTVTGWPRIAVDPIDERLVVEGFRYPSSTDVDDDLAQIWQANNLDAEAPLAHLDALVYKRSFVIVGSDGPGGGPLITVESPLHVVAEYDPRSRQIINALHVYAAPGLQCAALMTPSQTIQMERPAQGVWKVVDRDVHNFGQCCVVQMTNRQRAGDWDGRSEITDEIMSITDAACRTLLTLEVAREFYSVPQRYVLGASEADFQDAQGNPRTAWSAALSKFLMLEDHEDADRPTVGQFTAYDPSVYTKLIDMYARNMAGITRFPPQMFGLFSDGNPASADAIRMSQDGLIRKTERKQLAFEQAWEDVMRLALRFTNNGALPIEAARLETAWAEVGAPTISAISDAITKQVGEGIIPAQSDVTWEKLGYTPEQRARLRVDSELDAASLLLRQVSSNVEAKDARTGLSIAADLKAGVNGNPNGSTGNSGQSATGPVAP